MSGSPSAGFRAGNSVSWPSDQVKTGDEKKQI